MCGIAGILRVSPAGESAAAARDAAGAIPEAWLDILDRSIRHRGPDGQGRFRDRAVRADGSVVDVALVHRRLSIIDHAGGAQPMLAFPRTAGDPRPALLFIGGPGAPVDYRPVEQPPGAGLLATAFNGCIYNHRDLRRELQALGHRFATDHSDTEVLLHGTLQWGHRLAERLDGMYAYATWDRSRCSLTLARDPAGEKPLYIAPAGPGLAAFSTSVPGLAAFMRAAGHAPTVQPIALALWLKHGYWPDLPIDIAEALPGATYLLPAEDSATGLHPAARISARAPIAAGSLDEAEVERTLEAAVASRLEADVPIGCFLSGGVDSSVVAAFANRALHRTGRRLSTFTVRMPDSRMDESAYAQAVASHLGCDHAVLPCRASAAQDMQRLIAQLGLPFGDSSLLPTHWVSAAARSHVTVALGGDGGDELFDGYDRYRANALLHRYRVPLGWIRRVPASVPLPRLGGKTGRILAALRYHGYDDLLTIFRTPQLESLIGAGASREALATAYAGRGGGVGGDARQDDFDRYLPMDLMRKVDTASMAVALEVRAPLLARDLVRLALSVPREAVQAGEGRKGLLRRIARRLVPAEGIDRRKAGFGAPMGRWFREDFGSLRTLLRDRLGSQDPFPGLGLDLDSRFIRSLTDEHMAGRRDHGQRLYMLLALSIWADTLRG